jgi:Spy/CpxP family protein refolding chaperone
MALAMASLAAAQSSTANSPEHRPPEAPSQAAPGQSGATSQTPAGTTQSQEHTDEENPLNLTDQQKAKLQPILAEEQQQLEALRSNTSMTQEQKVSKANEIREAASPKIRAVLTPEQIQKLGDLQKARQQQNQSAPTDKTPPQ